MSDQAKAQNTDLMARKTQFEPVVAKHITFYKDGDYLFGGVKMALHPRRYRKFDTLLADLTKRIPGLAFGVRSVFTPRGRDIISSLDGMVDEGEYICSTYRHRAQGLDLNRVAVPDRWRFTKPRSANKELNEILGDVDFDEKPPLRRYGRTGAAEAFNSKQPKKLTVMKNGDPTVRHVVLLNRKTAQNFEQVLNDISDMFHMSVQKLFTLHGKRVRGLNQLFNGPDAVVASGREAFKPGYAPVPPSGAPRGRQNLMARSRTQGSVASRLRDRRDRLMKTKGHWTVWLTTNDLPTAGTKAQVTITVYGHKGTSRPLPLGYADGQHFQSGHIDEFDINVGTVGEIYKIRIGHDNTGEFPGWLCDEVRMKDKDTGEELVFPCKRWMARGEDDNEICRELPASRRGDPTLPVIKYEVAVETGDLWNAGTTANVYLTIYGDRGDTGVRQLYSEKKDKLFKKGQTDHFTVEAVSLGHLKRVIVGHDGSGPGSGWFLENLVIRDPAARQHEQQYKFHCAKWLDEGEGDGKIVRELLVQEEYMDDILEKRNWEHERWKFDNRNMLMFYSQLTGKALRVKGDGTVDGLGEKTEKGSIFTVQARKSFNRIFASVLNKNFHLAISEAKLTAQGRGGPYCEFRVRVQPNRTVILESVKYPLQFVTIMEDGKPGEVRGLIDKEPSRCFHVYCKGMFRNRGVVMLRTSGSQAVAVEHDNSLSGTGKLNKASHFRVHKVSEGGVRMLESMINPGKYIRLKDGHIDCLGGRDEDSHFIVEKHRDKGYVTLQSASQRGIYLGLTPEGEIRPTVDTGVNNIWLFPIVVDFGVPKQSKTLEPEATLIPSPSPASKQTTVSPRAEVEEGDWKIAVNSSSSLQAADVAIVVYGNQGNSGAIVLAAPVQNGPLFQESSMDEFKANFAKVGKIYKIRMELIPKSRTKDPLWRVRDVRMTNILSEEKLHFNFNSRWLSRKHDDGEIMRELPAIWPGERTPEVYKYQVRVYTGKEEGADTTAQVYLQIFGEKGDTGKRVLLRSNNPKPFQPGQLDIFEVEAVDLGVLEKVLVGHDGTAAGQGWYLDEIIIRKGPSGEEDNIFTCNRWLDSGMEDRKIERVLLARDPVPRKVKSEKKEVAATVVTTVEETKVEEVKAQSVAEEPVTEEVVEEIKEEEKFAEGEWKVFVTTGLNDGLSMVGDVFLYVYGSSGKYVGPLRLGSAQDGEIQLGETSEFKINLGTELGDIFKIRIGHEEENPVAGLFVEKVMMQDLTSKEQLNFLISRWVSRSRDDKDTWRESPVIKAGRERLAVVVYEVTVETGDEPGSDTDAAVYVILHGTRGDSGKRRLYQSKVNPDPFECGMRDMFLLEAVSLGSVQKVTVEHDGKGLKPGWFLKNMTVKESGNSDSEVFFPCDRWLDKDQDDGKTKRELKPGKRAATPPPATPPPASPPPASPPASEESKGEYKLWIKTGSQSDSAYGGKVILTAYGEKGVSKDIPLFAPSPQNKIFEPGNVDEFELSLGDIGDIYKIRVTKEDLDDWTAWFLEEVKLMDKDTKEEHIFQFQRWLSRQKEDFDIVRELPAVRNGEPVLPVRHYQVRVYTGNHWAAETNANVVVRLYGNKGDTGDRTLFHSSADGRKFQAGKVDVFDLEAVSLEGLQKVLVKHDGKGHGAGIFLDKVVVTETDGDEPKMQYIFPCGNWLDDGEGDGLTERTLRLIDATDKVMETPRRSPNTTRGDWRVVITTSDMEGAGTRAQVSITLFGSAGRSHRQVLGLANPVSEQFEHGSAADFEIRAGDIGRLSKVRLEHDNTNNDPSWHIDYIKLTDMDTEEEHVLYADCWISAEAGLCKEFPIVRPESKPLPVLQYIVAVETGSEDDSEAPNGSVMINLHGEEGDSGQRPLVPALTSSQPWGRGQTDIFTLEAVSLGSLEKLELFFDGEGEESSWYVSQVRILESATALRETVFNCQRWMVLEDGNERISAEFTVPTERFASPLPDTVEEALRGRKPRKSRGNFTAFLETGSQDGAGTTDNVCMVVYGVKGHTEPILLNGQGSLNAGSLLKTRLQCGDIGPIFKLRIFFQEYSSKSAWFLQWLRLKDEDTDEEFNFPYNDWVQTAEGNANGTVELPVTRPDIQPLQEMTYMVTVKTGDLALAETEARISLCLSGEWGDSGDKHLLESGASGKPFQRGQTDEFTIMTLDLGALKSVKVGHSFMGRGYGWYCEQVTVRPLVFNDVPTDTIFPCHRWLDTGCDDRALTRELKPLARIPTVGPPSASQTSRGIWTCLLTTATSEESGVAQQDTDISLMVYGSSGGVVGPQELTASDRKLFKPGRTDDFPGLDLGDVGEIAKIRVCAGQEDKKHVWTTKEILLQDEQTRQTLKFDFNQWVGEVNGDIRKELPVIRPREPFPRLVQYQVQLVTGKEKGAGVDAKVFITLYGTKGDSGRRVLAKSVPPKTSFQPGKTETFLVEAVDLGELTKVVVGKGPSDPWFLEKVLVKAGVFGASQSIFLFNRWIGGEAGSAKEEEEAGELTDVALSSVALPPEESAAMYPKSRGLWRIETVGGDSEGEGDYTDLTITFCGELGESTPIPLYSSSDKPFQPGRTDAFDVQVIEEVGDLFKVRLAFYDRSQPKALHLKQLKCEDQDTHDVFVCHITKPVQVTEEVDGVLELPIQWPALYPLPDVTYRVEVHTGEVKQHSKDSNAYVELYGSKGSTGRRQLKKSLTYDDKFEVDQIDLFEMQAVCLMEVNKVVIGHDGAGPDAGWFLKRAVISESLNMKKRYIFECNKWLDESEDDGKVERTLHLSKEPKKGTPPAASPSPPPKEKTPPPPVLSAPPKSSTPPASSPVPPPKSRASQPPTPAPVADEREDTPRPDPPKGHAWTVSTVTGSESGEGTASTVVLVLYGDKGVSSPVLIGEEEEFRFREGNTDLFEVVVEEDVGDLYKVRVGFQSADHQLAWYSDYTNSPSWFPEKVMLHDVERDKDFAFECRKWIKLDEFTDFWREFPVSSQEPLAVYNYMVTVCTGDVSGGGTDADVFLKLCGERGDSGLRHLHGSRTHTNKFEQGNKDIFFMEAVDLGNLTKVKVTQNGSGLGSEWYLDRVEVKVTDDAPLIYAFNHDKWVKEDEIVELPLTEVIDVFPEKPEEPAEGQEWRVLVTTSEEEGSGTDAAVTLTVYGDKGNSGPLELGQAGQGFFQSGSTGQFDIMLDPEKIGEILKIRLEHDNSGEESAWTVDKVVMQNIASGEELEFPVNQCLTMEEKTADIAVEVPAPRKQGDPLKACTYVVQITTADESGAGTDANVYIKLVGEQGDSGCRFLLHSLEEGDMFEAGKQDTFHIKAVDLGKLTNILVGHDNSGMASGWKLGSVRVREEASKEVSVFNYDGWLNGDSDDSTTEAEIAVSDVITEGDDDKQTEE